MTEAEREQIEEARARGQQVVVLDRCGQKPKVVRTPVPKAQGLSAKARIKLDSRRRRRAKQEAKDLGFLLFKEAEARTQQRVRELEAIMQSARLHEDNRALRQLYRALVDGVINAVQVLPPKPIKPTKARRVRRKKGD